ncbi:CUB domain-containing protein [Caenorhabditis elegans]|uniref:CUB domain-containing protein n=1 Tax=Caenorhabditis elegans TaxID=6239 RepID=D3YTA1_CAEEL|nr:CUB domain-containing protein [Caenorhabditis elegans]CBK19513.1 CUB domain-containing protein [Caenorhabditis elegans]|eukprot:NP_001256822.1 Uncharacterized protein CELE_Y69H2.17 [Caenorhabditis elegans]
MYDFLVFLWIFCSFCVQNAFSACECLDRIVLLHNFGDFRLISSPNYPEAYCTGMDCHWHFVAPNGAQKVHFSTDNLDIRKNLDQILFYDFKTSQLLENSTESFRCTGDDLCYYTSKFQYLTIRFKTQKDGEIDNFGFQAVVTVRETSNSAASTNFFFNFLYFANFMYLFI